MGRSPPELRRILSDNGLKAVSTHFEEYQLKHNVEKNIAGAKECGVSYIGLASLEDRRPENARGHQAGRGMVQPSRQDHREAGCHFFYHGHNFDYANVDGAVIYDELIRRTDSKFVNFELDCYWCVRAGKDPVDYFHRFPGRFPQLHIKDLKPGFPPPTGEGPAAFTEVGQGTIDWKKIFQAAKAGGLKHFYVEQDEWDRDSLESAKMSYEYLHNLNT